MLSRGRLQAEHDDDVYINIQIFKVSEEHFTSQKNQVACPIKVVSIKMESLRGIHMTFENKTNEFFASASSKNTLNKFVLVFRKIFENETCDRGYCIICLFDNYLQLPAIILQRTDYTMQIIIFPLLSTYAIQQFCTFSPFISIIRLI